MKRLARKARLSARWPASRLLHRHGPDRHPGSCQRQGRRAGRGRDGQYDRGAESGQPNLISHNAEDGVQIEGLLATATASSPTGSTITASLVSTWTTASPPTTMMTPPPRTPCRTSHS